MWVSGLLIPYLDIIVHSQDVMQHLAASVEDKCKRTQMRQLRA